MTSFGGQSRLPKQDPRPRRNADKWGNPQSIIGTGEPISLNGLGQLTIDLLSTGGLEVVSGELSIELDGGDLVLSADGLRISSAFRGEVQARIEDAKEGADALIYGHAAASEALKVSLFND